MSYIYAQLRNMNRQEAAVIDTEDTDVVVLSARVSHEIQGLLGIQRKKEVFDCYHLSSEEKCCPIAYVGATLPISPRMTNTLRNFALWHVYNDRKSKSFAESRASKWKKMKKKSTQLLPPDEDSS
eukprot:gene2406-2772_t